MSLAKLLTAGQVAELLQVPVATLYAWRYRGEGPPALRVGKYLRFRGDELERWLDAKCAADGLVKRPAANP